MQCTGPAGCQTELTKAQVPHFSTREGREPHARGLGVRKGNACVIGGNGDTGSCATCGDLVLSHS
jgi:hypothetical protein